MHCLRRSVCACSHTARGSSRRTGPGRCRRRRRAGRQSATLAHGALVYGMVGGKREERCRLIAAARELRCAPEVWAREIEETLNDLIPEDAPLLRFGSGADDDVDLRNTGKGVTKHAVAIRVRYEARSGKRCAALHA